MIWCFIAQVTPTPSPYSPLDFIRDPAWQFVGAIVSAFALVATYIIFRAERQRKHLTYQVLLVTPLISIREEEELDGRLVILFDNEPLVKPDIVTVVVKVSNTGNVPVDNEDYSGPIRFQLGSNAEVLTATIIATEPHDFGVVAYPEPNQRNEVWLDPVLLNKDESVTLKVLVRGAEHLAVKAHIKGTVVREYQESLLLSKRRLLAVQIAAIAFIFFAMLGVAGTYGQFQPDQYLGFILVGTMVLLPVIGLIVLDWWTAYRTKQH